MFDCTLSTAYQSGTLLGKISRPHNFFTNRVIGILYSVMFSLHASFWYQFLKSTCNSGINQDMLCKVLLGKWKNKALHGRYFNRLNKPFVDKRISLNWPRSSRSSRLKGVSEGFIFAAHAGLAFKNKKLR